MTANNADQATRADAFHSWVRQTLAAAALCREPEPVLAPVSGDAGFRSYYRIAGSVPPVLAVDAPPATEKNDAFCHIARLLRQNGIHAPLVYAADLARGFLLVEDLGGTLYWPLLQAAQATPVVGDAPPALYREAMDCLLKLHAIPAADSGLPPYDAARLRQEMDLFAPWFVRDLLGVPLSADVVSLLDPLFDTLIASALEQPVVVVHRDFHCRNLLKTERDSPGVIDFQDGVAGPVTYDLVSLLRDCYLRWPAGDVLHWAERYRCELIRHGLLDAGVDESCFRRWFDLMGLQRHIKVLGIFARLFLRDHKPGYLNDLPLVIHYTLTVARHYPEFAAFVQWFEEELLPRAKCTAWYRDLAA